MHKNCFCFHSKWAFSKYYKLSVGYFELKLRTPEIYITSCNKGHKSPSNKFQFKKNTSLYSTSTSVFTFNSYVLSWKSAGSFILEKCRESLVSRTMVYTCDKSWTVRLMITNPFIRSHWQWVDYCRMQTEVYSGLFCEQSLSEMLKTLDHVLQVCKRTYFTLKPAIQSILGKMSNESFKYSDYWYIHLCFLDTASWQIKYR